MGRSVLVVDDDLGMGEMVALGLGKRGFDARAVSSGESAIAALRDAPYEVVITDLEMPGMDGIALSKEIEAAHGVPVIVLTGRGNLQRAVEAIRAGVYDFLEKPADLDVLTIAVERALRHKDLSQEVKRLRDRDGPGQPDDGGMVGASRSMERLRDLVRRLAPADVSVLITGESGTGKELVARDLHQQSSRRDGPFVAINCAALPANLLESELFGHTAGSFTGAQSDKEGLFIRASNGTLFLDEIGEMPMEMQAKLLRSLQEQKVRPVGSGVEHSFDARIIAATNRDLEEDVEEGRFREDLYYRINVVHLPVPPLRARGGDILLLAQHFIERAARETGREVRGLNRAAADRLLAYPWPGNVRELENAMQRSVALARYAEVTIDDLPDRVRRDVRPVTSDVVEGEVTPESLPSLEELERRHILRVVEAADGNKTRAARILGVDRRTLYRKAERYGLDI